MLGNSSNKEAIIYLKDVPFTIVKAIVEYMYRGEVNLLGEELNLFLSFGKDLKIKGKPTFLICFLSTGVVQLLIIINKLFLEYIENAKQKIIFKNECKKLRKAVELKTVVLQIAIVCWFDYN